MSLKSPNLDDRSFADLMREAFVVIDRGAPEWTDRSPSDFGITMIEAFAHLTEVLIYRVNRIPEKAHFALLNLLGVGPLAPAPAEVTLTFTRAATGGVERDLPALVVPAGTVVTDRSGTLAFFTTADVEFPATVSGDEISPVEVLAVHAEPVDAELLGLGSGQRGESLAVKQGPILRRPSDPRSLVVGVEIAEGEADEQMEVRSVNGKAFGIWREVESFSGRSQQDPVYVVDRASGTITFGSGAGGWIPAKGREIRAWYLRGGGRQGNIAAGTLTTLKTPLRDVSVENRGRASGGEDMETLEQAVSRGREAVRVLRSAVTARDFENIARQVPGIARARAYAQRDVWTFGRPGVVDVLVVPRIDVSSQPDGITLPVLAEHRTPELIARTADYVGRHRPVGVEASVQWVRCRAVDISARVVLSAVEDKEAVQARLTRRLHALLAPDGSWPFGRPLRASDVYEVLLSEPGFRYAEMLSFTIADAPQADIREVHRDQSQPSTFYAAGRTLFRSLDGPESWALILERPGEIFLGVRTATALPGWVAAFSRSTDESEPNYVVYVSDNGGESWDDRRQAEAGGSGDRTLRFAFDFEIRDVGWTVRDGTPVLLIAGRSTIKSIRFSSPVNIDILPVRGSRQAEQADDARGFEAVATAQHVSGLHFVAVAAREQLGVYVAAGNGEFKLLPNTLGQSIRTLTFQQQANETFLWAGIAAEKGEPGKGALRIGMRIDGGYDPTGWQEFSANWSSGSCEALDFMGDMVAAGTNRGGILFWQLGKGEAWTDRPPIDCGLPLVDERRSIAPVYGVAQGAANGAAYVIAGGDGGTYLSRDMGRSYRPNGRSRFEDRVPLPRDWLFCSGAITVELAAEAAGEG